MPIYEYQCHKCHHQFEVLQKISDAPASECPHCHAADVERLVSAAGFQLKGTGWYVTDFKDKKPKTSCDTNSTCKTNSCENKGTKSE